jgi:hypothetical protein
MSGALVRQFGSSYSHGRLMWTAINLRRLGRHLSSRSSRPLPLNLLPVVVGVGVVLEAHVALVADAVLEVATELPRCR